MLAPTVQKLRLAIAFVTRVTIIAVIPTVTATAAICAAVSIGLIIIPRTAALPLVPRFGIRLVDGMNCRPRHACY